MRNAEVFGRKAITILYVFGLVGMLAIIAAIIITRKYDNEDMYSGFMVITDEWSLDRGGTQPADLHDIASYMDEETGVLSVYHKIPDLYGDVNLVYRSKDVYTKILIDDVLIYETDTYQSPFYNRSPGNLWNMVKISDEHSGKVIELQIYMVYDLNALTVDCVMWGDKADIILSILRGKSFGITVSMLMVVLGVVLIVSDSLPIYGKGRRNHSAICLGIYSLLMGIWSLIETNSMQFIVRDSRILQLVDNMVMITENLSMLLYLECEYQIFKNRLMRFIGYLDAFYILTCVFAQLTGIADMHELLPGSQIAMVIIDSSLFAWIIIKMCEMIKNRKNLLGSMMQLIGMCALLITSMAELMIYASSGDIIDRAEYIRVGMLVFIVCLTISSYIDTFKLIENGMKIDIISNLAYSDGLTGLGNRTAYLEQLEAYASGVSGISQLGIVFLDVNNLKKVNDNQGHEKGDELITIASKIIADSFGKFGKSYRIGGDEFCVLMEGGEAQQNYEKALLEFQNLVNEANKAKWYTYEIQIANGFGICDVFDKIKIEEAVAEADNAMYINKKMLKGQIQNA